MTCLFLTMWKNTKQRKILKSIVHSAPQNTITIPLCSLMSRENIPNLKMEVTSESIIIPLFNYSFTYFHFSISVSNLIVGRVNRIATIASTSQDTSHGFHSETLQGKLGCIAVAAFVYYQYTIYHLYCYLTYSENRESTSKSSQDSDELDSGPETNSEQISGLIQESSSSCLEQEPSNEGCCDFIFSLSVVFILMQSYFSKQTLAFFRTIWWRKPSHIWCSKILVNTAWRRDGFSFCSWCGISRRWWAMQIILYSY